MEGPYSQFGRYTHLIFGLETCKSSSSSSSSSCIRYLVLCGAELTADKMEEAAEDGSVESLSLLYGRGCPWDERVPAGAARSGKLENLEFCLDRGCPVNRDTIMKDAASWGNLLCMQSLRTRRFPRGKGTLTSAARSRKLACVEYALNNRCPRVPIVRFQDRFSGGHVAP